VTLLFEALRCKHTRVAEGKHSGQFSTLRTKTAHCGRPAQSLYAQLSVRCVLCPPDDARACAWTTVGLLSHRERPVAFSKSRSRRQHASRHRHVSDRATASPWLCSSCGCQQRFWAGRRGPPGRLTGSPRAASAVAAPARGSGCRACCANSQPVCGVVVCSTVVVPGPFPLTPGPAFSSTLWRKTARFQPSCATMAPAWSRCACPRPRRVPPWAVGRAATRSGRWFTSDGSFFLPQGAAACACASAGLVRLSRARHDVRSPPQ